MKQDSHDDDSDDDEDDVESILLEHTHQVGFLKIKVKAFYQIQSLEDEHLFSLVVEYVGPVQTGLSIASVQGELV